MNKDVFENPFWHLRAANGQNKNPPYLMTQGTQNAIIFGQRTLSKKCNSGATVNNTYTELPRDRLFTAKNKVDESQKTTVSLAL